MIAGGAWRAPLNLINANSSANVENNNKKMRSSDHAVTLTRENMAQHEARCGSQVVYYRTSEAAVIAVNGEAPFMMPGGDLSPTSAVRPKTCGLALAMVAIFCYFPGVSMIVSIGTVGITNKTVTGIVFTSVAVTLTVSSAVLCIRSRRSSHKVPLSKNSDVKHVASCKKQETHSYSASKALLSNRNDCCVEMEKMSGCAVPEAILCECEEIAITNKIAQSFSLNRYFATVKTLNGPFDLDHEAMDRYTERSIHGETHYFSSTSFAKRQKNELSSSTDSAIGIDYEVSSTEGVIVV